MATECFASDIGFYGDIFVRQIVYPEVGDFVAEHDHAIDHVTMVSQGAVHITCEVTGTDKVVHAPGFVEVPAKARHRIVAVEPNSCTWCIFRGDAGSFN